MVHFLPLDGTNRRCIRFHLRKILRISICHTSYASQLQCWTTFFLKLTILCNLIYHKIIIIITKKIHTTYMQSSNICQKKVGMKAFQQQHEIEQNRKFGIKQLAFSIISRSISRPELILIELIQAYTSLEKYSYNRLEVHT